MSDEHEHEHRIEIPPQVVQALIAGHDLHHMRQDSEQARLDRFLDGLDADDLLAVRFLLTCSPESAFANAMHYSGVVHTLLRLRHGVDPRTGKTFDEQLQPSDPSS